MRRLLLISILFFNYLSYAQTWADDVAQIVYDKCSKCHHSGGIAPFPLTTYAEVSPMASMIQTAVSSESMPPWPPDNNYQTYAHDRSLSATEKTTVLDWITNGTPEGNAANTPPVPVFQTGSVLGSGDLEVQIPTYMSKATASGDDYVCFALPSNLAVDRKIRAVEIVPGNRQIVHHCLVYVDPAGASVTDTVGGDCGGPSSSSATLVMGYTPGSSPLVLPSSSPLKLGMTMPANSQVVMAMHFPEGSYGEYDSTKVIFHFYPQGETGIREVSTAPILQNWSFSLPPDQETSVSTQYPASGGLPLNYSILSTFPHMHLLGKSMRVYGIQPNGDTLKLINIPDWDFEWQDFYFFKNIQKAQAGSYLKADAVYDNTTANINNPNFPPQWVYAGLNTTDEMFLVYFHYMLYQSGDENYNMDSLLTLSTSKLIADQEVGALMEIYPNPFNSSVTISASNLNQGDKVSMIIYDMNGNKVKTLSVKDIVSDQYYQIEWDGTTDEGGEAATGMYFLSVNLNGMHTHQRIIKN